MFFQDVLEGSILGPLLLNLFPSDFFLFVEEAGIMRYIGNNTPYICSENIDFSLEKLKENGN